MKRYVQGLRSAPQWHQDKCLQVVQSPSLACLNSPYRTSLSSLLVLSGRPFASWTPHKAHSRQAGTLMYIKSLFGQIRHHTTDCSILVSESLDCMMEKICTRNKWLQDKSAFPTQAYSGHDESSTLVHRHWIGLKSGEQTCEQPKQLCKHVKIAGFLRSKRGHEFQKQVSIPPPQFRNPPARKYQKFLPNQCKPANLSAWFSDGSSVWLISIILLAYELQII